MEKGTRERQSWMMVGGLSIIIAIGLTFSSLSNWYIVATIGLLAFSIYKYAETGIPGSWPWVLRARREYLSRDPRSPVHAGMHGRSWREMRRGN